MTLRHGPWDQGDAVITVAKVVDDTLTSLVAMRRRGLVEIPQASQPNTHVCRGGVCRVPHTPWFFFLYVYFVVANHANGEYAGNLVPCLGRHWSVVASPGVSASPTRYLADAT